MLGIFARLKRYIKNHWVKMDPIWPSIAPAMSLPSAQVVVLTQFSILLLGYLLNDTVVLNLLFLFLNKHVSICY